MTDVWKPAIRVEVEFGLSYFISGCSLSLLSRKKKIKYVPFPTLYNLFMDCAGCYFVEKPKKTIFPELYLTGLPASFKVPVRKQQSSSEPIASDYLTPFPP